MTFEVGDWLYLKLQPYRQLSIKTTRLQNFPRDTMDLFRFWKRWDQWLTDWNFQHPFPHISLLKPHKGNTNVSSTPRFPLNF